MSSDHEDEQVKSLAQSTAERDAQELMNGSLPSYIVKCLTAAGFDTIDVLSKMDVSNEPGNSIDQVEQFISDEHPEYMNSRSKKFPPGHRIRIRQFIECVKQMQSTSAKKVSLGKRRRSVPKNNSEKKSKVDSCDESSVFTDSDQASSMEDIQRQICKWQQRQTNDTLKKLMDHEHYQISVTATRAGFIKCLRCMRAFRLGTKNSTFMISNWTRHVIKCHGNDPGPCQTVSNFTSSSAASSGRESSHTYMIPNNPEEWNTVCNNCKQS